MPFMHGQIQVRLSKTAICTNVLAKPVSLNDEAQRDCSANAKEETSSPRKGSGRGWDSDQPAEAEKRDEQRSPSPSAEARKEGNENVRGGEREDSFDAGDKRKRSKKESSPSPRKQKRTDKQVSWWEKEGKYKK